MTQVGRRLEITLWDVHIKLVPWSARNVNTPRFEELIAHPIALKKVTDSTKSVFKQSIRMMELGYLLFEDAAEVTSDESLLLHQPTDIVFAKLIFLDHIGNLNCEEDIRYSFHFLFSSK